MKITSYKEHPFKVTCYKCNTKIEFLGNEAKDYRKVEIGIMEEGFFVFIDCPVCKQELSAEYTN